jgi:hypothetical protein
MSQNPEHTPRRALSPPAVTRFQLRTASATEAVFSPPYLPAPPDRAGTAQPPPAETLTPEPFPEPAIRRQPTALPPVVRSRELPRPAPPTRAVELPPVRGSEPARPEPARTEPGTWREIIARFERELGPVTDDEAADTTPSHAELSEAEPAADAPDAGVEPPSAAPVQPDATLPDERVESDEPEEPVSPDEPLQRDSPMPDEIAAAAQPIEPGDPPFIDEPVPWEIESMTTRDYSPPHSIRDAEHDWPVDAEDGDAVPAWSDEPAEELDDDTSPADEIGELLLDEVVPADPWDREPEPDEDPAPRSDFPLDAFIVPAGVPGLSGFADDDLARRVAVRLDELARGLRDDGLRSLGSAGSVDELSRVLAAIVTGYVSREG